MDINSINDLFNFIVNRYGWVCLVMVVLVTGILEILKAPIKKLTAKIKNEQIRKLCNKIFIFMSFGLSFGLLALGNYLLPKYVRYDFIQVILTGSFSNVVYALGDGIISTPKAKKLVETIAEVTDDGKVDAEDVAKVIEVAKLDDDVAKNENCNKCEYNSKKEETPEERYKSALERFNEEISK